MSRLFSELSLSNDILLDLSRDIWSYVSYGELGQLPDPDADGSSAMPNKVNPINFENAEANLGIANAILRHLADKLPISRMQRDLSDSAAQRAMGEGFGHSLVAYKNLQRGLSKVIANEVRLSTNLDNEWAVLMEPLQTVMRRYGIEGAYDTIKAASRGKNIDQSDYLVLVDSIDGLPEEGKERLRQLTPALYTGRAAEIARRELD